MSQLSKLIKYQVGKESATGYNLLIMSMPEDNKPPRQFYINLKSKDEVKDFVQNYVQRFISMNGNPRIFVNSFHNKKVTETYRFFIDIDFAEISSDDEFRRKDRNLHNLFDEIKRVVGTVYGDDLASNMIIWGRDMYKTHLMKFHVHFPQICTDTSTGPDVVEYIRQNIGEIPGFDREEIYLAIDTAPAASGNIRVPLSSKYKTTNLNPDSDNGRLNIRRTFIPDSEYFLYSPDLEVIYPPKDDIMLQSTYIKALCDSMIMVFNESTIITPSEVVDRYRQQKYYTNENLQAKYFGTTELIAEIQSELRSKGINTVHRGIDGKVLKFDTTGPHPCPVNPDKRHARENLFCVIRPNGVYVYCYAIDCKDKNGELLIDRKFNIPIPTARYKPRDAGYYTRTYDINGGIDYMNKFFATNAIDGGLVKFSYDPANPDRLIGYDFLANNYTSIIACDVTLPNPEKKKKPDSIDLGRVWAKSEYRRYINKIEFMGPEDFESEYGEEDDAFNAFIGFDTPIEDLREYWNENRRLDHYKEAVFWFKRHIRYFWCFSEGRPAYDFTMDWLSWNVRNPTKTPNSALCLVGELGTLKSGIFDLFFRKFFGQYFMSFTDPAVVDKWKGNLQYKMFVVWDEAKVNAELATSLKALITEQETYGAIKNVNHKSFTNTASFVIITNDAEKFQVDPGTRRYMFINTYNLFTRGYFDEFRLNGTEDQCIPILRPIIGMTKDEYYSVFFEKIDWRDIITYLLFDHEISPGFSTNTILNTSKLVDLKIKSESRLVKFLVESIHNPAIYDSMEVCDEPVKIRNNMFTHRIPTAEFIPLINEYVPAGRVNAVNIGTFRTNISRRMMRCVAIETVVEDDISVPGGQERVSYFYLADQEEVIRDLARLMGTSIDDIKHKSDNTSYIAEIDEPEL